jgi:hypothetical protein
MDRDFLYALERIKKMVNAASVNHNQASSYLGAVWTSRPASQFDFADVEQYILSTQSVCLQPQETREEMAKLGERIKRKSEGVLSSEKSTNSLEQNKVFLASLVTDFDGKDPQALADFAIKLAEIAATLNSEWRKPTTSKDAVIGKIDAVIGELSVADTQRNAPEGTFGKIAGQRASTPTTATQPSQAGANLPTIVQ